MQPSALSAAPPRPNFWLYASLIVLCAVLLNMATLNGEMIMDDRLLLHNPDERGCDTSVGECFRNPLFHLYYRPVLSASFLLGLLLHGAATFWFHAENLLLHGLAVAVWLGVFRKLLRSDRGALVAGLLFALHPVQAGVTGFIGGRTDTLALVFLGSSLLMLERAINLRKAYYPASLLCFALAAFTKEQSALTILLLPSFLALTATLSKRQALYATAPFALIVLAYLLIARTILPPDFIPRLGLSPNLHIEIIGRTLWYYVKNLSGVVPSAFHQSSLGAWSPNQWQTAVLGYAALGGWVLPYFALCRREPRLAFCWRWASLALLPCLNLIPTPSQYVAPFRVPLALPGAAGIAALLFAGWAEKQRFAKAAKATLCGVATLYALLTLQEALLWRSEVDVLQTMTRVDPDFLPAHLWLGNAYQLREQPLKALEEYASLWKRLNMERLSPDEKMVASREKGVRERVWSLCGWSYAAPRFTGWVLHQEGRTLSAMGDYAGAIAPLTTAFKHDTQNRELRQFLANAYIETQQYPQAQELLLAPLKTPPDAMTYQLRGYLYAKLERWKEANAALERAWEAQPPLDSKARESNRRLFAYVQRRNNTRRE